MKNILPLPTTKTDVSPSLFHQGWESSFSPSEHQFLPHRTNQYGSYRIDILGIFHDVHSFWLSLRERIVEQSEQRCKTSYQTA